MDSPAQSVRLKRGRQRGPAGSRKFYQVDTKGMCMFCLRDRQRMGGKKHISDEISSKCCKVLLRYYNLDFYQHIVKPSNFKWKPNKVKEVGIELCQDCALLASSFQELYCQLELIQMKLNAYSKTISDIIKIAGRIPSRVKLYQERMGIIRKVTTGNLNGGPMSHTLHIPKPALLAQTFRKELMQKGINKNKLCSPRIYLMRKEQNTPDHSRQSGTTKFTGTTNKAKTRLKTVALLNSPLSRLIKFILAYTFSFATVWLLTSTRGGNFILSQNTVPVVVIANKTNKSVLSGVNDVPVESSGDERPSTIENDTSPMKDDKGSKQAANRDVEAVQQNNTRRNSITITDSGKTVLLPHQSFKTETDFVDESIMEYEDNTELIDISDDGFFADANSMSADMNISSTTNLSPPVVEVIKQEPQESILEVNDRTCTECRIHLSCRAELEKHLSVIHKWENYVKCPVCKNMYSCYQILKNHRKEHESCAISEASEALEFLTIAKPVFPYSSTVRGNRFCPMEGCFEVFLKAENLQMHLKAHGLFSCSQGSCKEKFDKAHELALHESHQHSNSVQFSGYKCTRCNFHVGGQYQYILHFLSKHLSVTVYSEQCNICQKGFISKGKMLSQDKDVHFKTYHDIKGKDPKSVIKCDIDSCKAFFLTKHQLSVHKVYIHYIEQDFKYYCSICGVRMLNQHILSKHKLKAHSNLPSHEIEAKLKRRQFPRKGKYNCMYCGNQYSSKYALLIHSKVHDHLKDTAEPTEDKISEESHQEPMQVEEEVTGNKVGKN